MQGQRHGWTSKVNYSEMDYWTYSGKREERAYEKKAEEWWTLADDGRQIEVMRIRGKEVEMTRYTRTSSTT